MSTQPAQSEPAPSADSVFGLVLGRLAASGIVFRVESGPSKGETYAEYGFADESTLGWSATTVTGAESSAEHPPSAHAKLEGFFLDDREDGSEERGEFATGDFETDAAALVAWVTKLADRHGRAVQQ